MRTGKWVRFSRKIVALAVVLGMVLNILPWRDIRVFAAVAINSVTILRVYDQAGNEVNRVLAIEGSGLKDAVVKIWNSSSGYVALNNRTMNDDVTLQFTLAEGQTGDKIDVAGTKVTLNESTMPNLTSATRKVNVDDTSATLVLKGNNLNNVDTTRGTAGISASYEQKGVYVSIPAGSFAGDGTSATINHPTGGLGMQNIVFEKIGNSPDAASVPVKISYTYQNQFTFVKKINVSNLDMHPNMGMPKDTVYFEAPYPNATQNLDNYDVFFLKSNDGTDPYSNSNKGTNKTFTANSNGKSILTVQVPSGLAVGEYYVVLTNAVDPNANPNTSVTQEMWLTDKFTVVDGTKSMRIWSINPASGPDTGSQATLTGQFFASIGDITNFSPTGGSSATVNIINPNADGSPPKELDVEYPNGGKYKNSVTIDKVTRTIRVLIGGEATFLKNTSNKYADYDNTTGKDTLYVMTPQVTDAETNPVKDVVIETVTTLKPQSGADIVIKERAVLTNGYTYIPSSIVPTITDVTPNIIQVTPVTASSGYEIAEDRMIAIHGKNFMITRYTDASNNVIVRYPKVELGSEITLDKNSETAATPEDQKLYIKVLDANGRELDGSTGNELGTKILVKVPAGTPVTKTGKTYVRVTNPMRNNNTQMGKDDQKTDYISFFYPGAGKSPVITSVTPSVVSVDGGDTITVVGSFFDSAAKVFIDGEEVRGATHSGDGKKITFTCPKGREGETQLQVMNPDGGIAVFEPFKYVRTYTNPKISDFAPKAGNTGTLVVISGDNFLKPDPTATTNSLEKLIGTRVFLGTSEVNEYNLNSTTKQIELRSFTAASGDELLQVKDDGTGKKLALADYYSGVVLQDASKSNHFYTIDKNARGEIILSDWAGNDYTLSLNSSGGFIASRSGGSIVGVSQVVDPVTDVTKLTINEASPITLNVMTLYKVDDTNHKIVGNRVKVMDKTQIYFTVPKLNNGDGYYDLIVMNPDTKKDSKTGNNGFYYYSSTHDNPEIDKIDPNEGSVDGGYTITITGKNFENSGNAKSKVFINGVEVSAQNVAVGVDQNTITAVVPAYSGDLLADKGTSRLTVPVVVLNPSYGNSASVENGFTYVVPGSHPKIAKIVPQKGSAAGGDIVEITGTDFRFFEPFTDADNDGRYDDGSDSDHDGGNAEEWNDINNNNKWDDLTTLTKQPTGEPEDPEVKNDLRVPVLLSNNSTYKYYYSSSILPKVYFGQNLAKIVEYSNGYIKVIVPKGTAGTANVFVVNNDSGTSNKVGFTYQASSPAITGILPAEGKRQGGDKVEIHGSGFAKNSMDVYTAVDGTYTTEYMPAVRFGNITNLQTDITDPTLGGRILNSRATVKFETEGLTVSYDGSDTTDRTVTVTLNDNGVYTATIHKYDKSEKYIPTHLLVDDKGTAFDAGSLNRHEELIRIMVTDEKLVVERGYAPTVQYTSATQLVVTTPYYYTVGVVPVTLFNPDGGTATGQFEYKNPASNPKIINITRDGLDPASEGSRKVLRVNYKGGSIISVTGQDFRENAKIQISDVLTVQPANITYSLPNKLTFTMPAVPESAVGTLYRVTVINTDGGSAFSDEASTPIYILFTKGETNPTVTSVTPDSGSANGGNTVTITGSDFRSTMSDYPGKTLSVYFGGVQATSFTVVDYKTITVVVPAGTAGKVKVRVENPDGAQSSENVFYTYISSPEIIAVVDPADPNENTRITTISVEGGQKIKLKGSGFMPGARIVFVPDLTELEDISKAKGQVIYIGGQAYSLNSGTNGTSVQYIDSETLTVVTPAGKLGTKGVIVINPDSGATEKFDDLVYGLPELSTPMGVQAELVYDRYIKVYWKAVEGAQEYEIYVVADNEMELAGSTKYTSFVYSDLEPNTRYKFIVKAIGNFGPSQPSAESNTVKTGSKVGPPDEDNGLTDNTVIKKSGDTADISIGENDFDKKAIVIDLTSGSLAGSKEVVVSIPAAVVVSTKAKDITVLGKDFKVKFSPNAFKSSNMEQNKNKNDAGVRIKISAYVASADLGSDGSVALSTQYEMRADAYVGKDYMAMDYLSQYIEITLDYDSSKAEMRRLQNITINRYEGYGSGWNPMGYADAGAGAVSASTNRLGRYMVIGRRR